MSTSATPSSFSSSSRTAWAEARGLEDDVGDLQAAAVGALDDVLGAGDRGRDDVDLGLEADPGHAERIADAVLVVDHVLLWQDVEHLAVHRDRDPPWPPR
jgi:hypothetical protein